MSMALTANQLAHQAKLDELALQKVATELIVPTLPQDVRHTLREYGQPVRLFGENLAQVRQRLRLVMARAKQNESTQEQDETMEDVSRLPQQTTQYTRATTDLFKVRQELSTYSLKRARDRLERERERRVWGRELKANPNTTNRLSEINEFCQEQYKSVRKWSLQATQYADDRGLSCVKAHNNVIATASWTGQVKFFDAKSLEPLEDISPIQHEDRCFGIDFKGSLLATASLDKIGKVYRFDDQKKLTHLHDLTGHQRRLCRVAIHPCNKYVATTSSDYSWRMWDVESGKCLLLQDGHAKECYGIDWGPDGNLVATTDWAGVTHIWDVRTSKSIWHANQGHVGRVLNASWSPNGFQLATSGDDGTIRIWDVRRKKCAAVIPAHSRVITSTSFGDEILTSSSMDGQARIWSARSWELIASYDCGGGVVSGCHLMHDGLVTCGFDKTLKLFR